MIFVWTSSDVVQLLVLGTIVVIALLAWALVTIDNYRKGKK